MIVLVISSRQDGHVVPVLRELSRRRGVRAELVDHGCFPTEASISMAFGGGTKRLALSRHGSAALPLEEVDAVWWRRPQPFGTPACVTDAGVARFIRSEASTALAGAYQCLDALWINRPDRDACASHKPWQLHLAQQCGLTIPKTLMTNDPEAASAFWEDCGRRVIYKQFVALPEHWRETRLLDEAAMSRAATIAHAPVIFQEHIEAVAELRITVIGDRLFAAGVDLRAADYPIDVRFNPSLRHAAHELPLDLCERLRSFVRKLGLCYAAIDMRLTADGAYVFLEANPAGQFYYIEQMTDQPITAALADALVSGPGMIVPFPQPGRSATLLPPAST